MTTTRRGFLGLLGLAAAAPIAIAAGKLFPENPRTARFRRYKALYLSTSALVEGKIPTNDRMQIEWVEA